MATWGVTGPRGHRTKGIQEGLGEVDRIQGGMAGMRKWWGTQERDVMPVLREWERQGTGKSGERCRVGKADRCPGSVPSECSQFHGDGAMV